MSELSEGEGGFKPNWEFVPKGPRENVISDLNMLFVMAEIIVLILNDWKQFPYTLFPFPLTKGRRH